MAKGRTARAAGAVSLSMRVQIPTVTGKWFEERVLAFPPLTPDFVPPLSHASGERGKHKRAVSFIPFSPLAWEKGNEGLRGS